MQGWLQTIFLGARIESGGAHVAPSVHRNPLAKSGTRSDGMAKIHISVTEKWVFLQSFPFI